MAGAALIIVNPAAGRGAGQKLIPQLESWAGGISPKAEVYITSGPGDARRRAEEAVREGWELVVAAGGDGTLSEVASALVDTPMLMGILPVGTGNDLARHLGLPLHPLECLRSLMSYREIPIDVGLANGIPFLVAAGTGFDAAVAEDVNRGVWFFRGSLAYAVATLRTLWRYRCTSMRIQVDDNILETFAYFTVVANARGYGGGMKIAPDASIRDGLLDVCCVKGLSRWRFLAAAGRVYRGQHVTHPAVRMLQGSSIRVESNPPVSVVVDGELRGQTPLVVTMKAGSLKLAFPEGLPLPF